MNNYYMHGPVFGTVTDNTDPDQLGRVKVMIDHLGEKIETGWIPVITSISGLFVLPEIKDQVIVSFIGDNATTGIVLGSAWNSKQLPPESGENTGSDLNKDGDNNLRFIKSRSGHKLILDDKKGEEKVQVITGKGKTRMEFLAKEGSLKITTDKNINISAKKKLIINGQEGTIKMKKGLLNQGENIKIEGKGKDINIKAGKNVVVEGSGINLN
jgi:uncharacterized protein involved in type VI secretion and phage assembly